MECGEKVFFRDDASKYWNLQELAEPPVYLNAPFADTKADGLQDILYEGVAVDGNKLPVFAYIGYPDSPMPDGGYPGIVLVHGGGGTAFPEYANLWRSYGYAVIAVDWYNRHPVIKKEDGKDVCLSDRIEMAGGMRDNHQVRVANMILAHSLLRSLKNVNANRTGYVGLSWGSWYGAIVASVDDRFKFSLQIYCGDCKKHLVNGIPLTETGSDIINGRFLHSVKIPMYWVSGTNDAHMSPATWQCAWEECPVGWNHSLVVALPHSHIGFTFPVCRRVADYFLQGGTELPKLGGTKFESNVISAEILSEGKGIIETVLCYTLDDNEVTNERQWHRVPAERKGNMIFAEVPENAVQCFLSAYDEKSDFDDCCGSSDVISFTAVGK